MARFDKEKYDTISVSRFMNDLRNYMVEKNYCSFALSYNDVVEVINKQPYKDVRENAKGEWEVIDGSEPRRYGCSVCKRLSWDMSNFCPNCGADLRGGNYER